MHFLDECVIDVKGGAGGSGCIAFHRYRGNPRGGPAGGDGADGGSVILYAEPQISTLLDLHFQREYRAERGGNGEGRDRHGRRGADRLVPVPVGTVVKDADGEVLADLATPGQRFVAAQGGTGGHGNIYFATPTNQAPERADPGTPGEERRLRLELK